MNEEELSSIFCNLKRTVKQQVKNIRLCFIKILSGTRIFYPSNNYKEIYLNFVDFYNYKFKP